MIPKLIHYCWFGGNKKTKEMDECIQSWKKYFPNYEIIEWNESNFDIKCCDYVWEAYCEKKWAFVSDYARFHILYEHGGVYFDTDVEVIKSFGDILDKGAFMGCEMSLNGDEMINPGLGLAADKHMKVYKEILDYYEKIHFDLNHILTVVDYTTTIMEKHGFKRIPQKQYVEGIYIYPSEYFCPIDMRTGIISLSERTYSIHHYSGSWQSQYSKMKARIRQLLGPSISHKISQMKRKLLKCTKSE